MSDCVVILFQSRVKMDILLRVLTGAFFSIVIASCTVTHTEKPSLIFQVNQSQIKFDSSSVESANLVETGSTQRNFYGLQLKLKTDTAKELGKLTEKHIGEQSTFMQNGRVVSSAVIQSKLGDD